jgi:hypothetical protein
MLRQQGVRAHAHTPHHPPLSAGAAPTPECIGPERKPAGDGALPDHFSSAQAGRRSTQPIALAGWPSQARSLTCQTRRSCIRDRPSGSMAEATPPPQKTAWATPGPAIWQTSWPALSAPLRLLSRCDSSWCTSMWLSAVCGRSARDREETPSSSAAPMPPLAADTHHPLLSRGMKVRSSVRTGAMA